MSQDDSTRGDVVPGERVPEGSEAGAGSTPGDGGAGVVDVGDRTDDGAPAANQSKTEPMPPSPAHDDPDAAPEPATVEAPDLDSMNVGAGDPQAPSHPAAGPAGDRADAGLPATETPVAGSRPGPHANLGAPTGDGVAEREQQTTGSAFRTPGSMGVEGADEQIETDTERSAARTNVAGTPGAASGAGNASSVPVVSEEPSPGTSQESAEAHGSRTPL